jgi:hypothetical protein
VNSSTISVKLAARALAGGRVGDSAPLGATRTFALTDGPKHSMLPPRTPRCYQV